VIGLDTNVLVRYIMQDDPGQSPRATSLIASLDVDRPGQVLRALRVFETGKADFADCLIERTAASAGCGQSVTFDVNAARHAGMMLIR